MVTKSLTIEGKYIPTRISFAGENLDSGAGDIEVTNAIRKSNGEMHYLGVDVFPISTQLDFVDSNGISGLAVMRYLAEWFDHVNT